jgi:hypothetical protein
MVILERLLLVKKNIQMLLSAACILQGRELNLIKKQSSSSIKHDF